MALGNCLTALALAVLAVNFASAQTPAAKGSSKVPVAAAATTPAPAPRAGPTPEQQAQIAELKREIEHISQDLASAKRDDEKYTGGLIKAQIGMRIEILNTTIALLQHRLAALQSGAKFVPQEVPLVAPDPAMVADLEREIAATKEKVAANRTQQERYSGGLILAQMKSTEATMNETLALMERRLLMAKYGITPVAVSNEARKMDGNAATTGSSGMAATSTGGEKKAVAPALADTILTVNLISKRRIKQKYDEMIILNMDVAADGLDKPARAIKGVLKVTDLFGETKVPINWSFDNPVAPGSVIQERDKGVKYSQFSDADRWLDSTDQQNMKMVFTVKSILYEDGSRRDF